VIVLHALSLSLYYVVVVVNDKESERKITTIFNHYLRHISYNIRSFACSYITTSQSASSIKNKIFYFVISVWNITEKNESK
jgi:predicted transcriptional regulator YheO